MNVFKIEVMRKGQVKTNDVPFYFGKITIKDLENKFRMSLEIKVFSWRITKYNPKNRNSRGIYLIDEWTSYSDIGKIINNQEFTYKEYIETENAYVVSIILFMKCNDLETLKIKNLEKPLPLDLKDKFLSEKMKICFNVIRNSNDINKNEIDSICRLILREKLWCKLESKDMFVHFGWDYYMYIGSMKRCEKCINEIQQLNLFVEQQESPYMK
ncbi:MAG: hypothetical protein WA432_00720 [Candidatus Babeliaceae bacterium]